MFYKQLYFMMSLFAQDHGEANIKSSPIISHIRITEERVKENKVSSIL